MTDDNAGGAYVVHTNPSLSLPFTYTEATDTITILQQTVAGSYSYSIQYTLASYLFTTAVSNAETLTITVTDCCLTTVMDPLWGGFTKTFTVAMQDKRK